ncbi:NADH-quinone oxidoreductase subunit NuoH [Blastococcus sp. Marseille-P5729]|uniref:NADH-quinone oxidoreductase subunit NuoH n=1 Tax=Blastococcus sp. Marseille-P5729 TaxID=2086582 RepID=UPI0018FEF465|nr:NADH-quinone oxidoreductase subunit NuoH [Blastococcus sp. Marseille-P5729]
MNVLAAIPANMPTLEDFGKDPLWITLIKTVGAFALLVVVVILVIVWERKLIGYMQNRTGPNRNSPWALLQSLFDGVKLAFKEEVIPKMADKPVYWLAPVIIAFPAFMAFSVIPVGPMVSMFGHWTPMQLTDTSVGVLVILACASVGAYGVLLAGWSSGSAYPLIGGLRSTAQIVSYEIAMGLSIVGVFMWAGTMSTSEIVAAQAEQSWFFWILPISCIIYLIAMVGETNRAPFDLAEAESELVGGFHTEYSSMKFAMFFLAEYVNMATVSALATTMFFGGWQAPFWIDHIWEGANSGWWPLLWWFGKVWFFLSCFVWLRGALPRMRYDQFMVFGWKFMIPVVLAWTMFMAVIRTGMVRNGGDMPLWGWIAIATFAVLTLAAALAYVKRPEPEQENINANPPFPIPPMNLAVPSGTRSAAPQRGRVGARRTAGAIAAKETNDG